MRMNAKKKEKTRRETTAIKVWVTPAEKAAITVKADAYSLSASCRFHLIHTLAVDDFSSESTI